MACCGTLCPTREMNRLFGLRVSALLRGVLPPGPRGGATVSFLVLSCALLLPLLITSWASCLWFWVSRMLHSSSVETGPFGMLHSWLVFLPPCKIDHFTAHSKIRFVKKNLKSICPNTDPWDTPRLTFPLTELATYSHPLLPVSYPVAKL